MHTHLLTHSHTPPPTIHALTHKCTPTLFHHTYTHTHAHPLPTHILTQPSSPTKHTHSPMYTHPIPPHTHAYPLPPTTCTNTYMYIPTSFQTLKQKDFAYKRKSRTLVKYTTMYIMNRKSFQKILRPYKQLKSGN